MFHRNDEYYFGRSGIEGLQVRLEAAFRGCWKQYCKAFKRTRRKLSEKAVHQLRVETRRLLSLLNLAESLVGERMISTARRRFKKTLKRFARLRDTQVQLLAFAAEFRQHPHSKAFRRMLRRREEKLKRRIQRRFHEAGLDDLKRAFFRVNKAVRAYFQANRTVSTSLTAIVGGVDKAFSTALKWQRAIDPSDPATIHRLRVAFKKFRYMLEALRDILPGMVADRTQSMQDYQARMGEIQDARLLLMDLDGLRRKANIHAGAVIQLREELAQKQRRLVDDFLLVNDRLQRFWAPRTRSARSRPTVGTSNTV